MGSVVVSVDLRHTMPTTNRRLIETTEHTEDEKYGSKSGIQRVSQLSRTVSLTYRIYRLGLRVRIREIRKYAGKRGNVAQVGVKSGEVEFQVERPCVVVGGG